MKIRWYEMAMKWVPHLFMQFLVDYCHKFSLNFSTFYVLGVSSTSFIIFYRTVSLFKSALAVHLIETAVGPYESTTSTSVFSLNYLTWNKKFKFTLITVVAISSDERFSHIQVHHFINLFTGILDCMAAAFHCFPINQCPFRRWETHHANIGLDLIENQPKYWSRVNRKDLIEN